MAEPRMTRPVSWLKGALNDFRKFPEGAQTICLAALTITAEGGKADIAKPMRRADWRRYLGRACVPEEIDQGHKDAPTPN
jgi:hypothetical protein